MAWRCSLSHLKRSWRGQQRNISLSTIAGVSSPVESADKRFTTLGKRATSFVLLGLTGAFALSAFDDFAIYYNCSRVSSPVESADKRFTTLGKRATSFVLLGLTGAFALSAFDDFAIYYNCSSKAIEKVTNNASLREALGEPITRGQWYNATLSVAHHKHSVSCTFPVVGSHGSGILQLKAVRRGDNNWFTFLGSQEWEILFLEALVHTRANEESKCTFRINLMTDYNLPDKKDCKECKLSTSSKA